MMRKDAYMVPMQRGYRSSSRGGRATYSAAAAKRGYQLLSPFHQQDVYIRVRTLGERRLRAQNVV
jgi:hypothetical protein